MLYFDIFLINYIFLFEYVKLTFNEIRNRNIYDDKQKFYKTEVISLFSGISLS